MNAGLGVLPPAGPGQSPGLFPPPHPAYLRASEPEYPPPMKNLSGLMRQAQDMQAKMAEMQAKLETLETEGVAGAGMVRVTLSGRGEMRAITIDPKLADAAEMEMLQDLIVAAHHDAKAKSEALAQEEMQKATGGLNLPGGLKLPF
jgi:DNA-binding YbaB/EbfC family protein